MPKRCKDCGYRINPANALGTGLVSKSGYDENFGQDHRKSWCDLNQTWILDKHLCPDWISWQEHEGERKYR